MKREKGYYWIRFMVGGEFGGWQIGYYSSYADLWYVVNVEGEVKEPAHIGPRIEEPSK